MSDSTLYKIEELKDKFEKNLINVDDMSRRRD